jgi:SOS response regulatory protein OraA/RecX
VYRFWGDFRIRLSLREKGVSPDVADEALREVRRELGEGDAIRKYIQKKYGKTIESDINSKEFTPGEKRRLFRSLSNRGFPGGLILEIIRMPKEEMFHDGE